MRQPSFSFDLELPAYIQIFASRLESVEMQYLSMFEERRNTFELRGFGRWNVKSGGVDVEVAGPATVEYDGAIA